MSTESNSDKRVVSIELTAQQKDQVFAEIGKTGDAIVLTPQELEERVAPRLAGGWGVDQ